jgi:hypothetical protein
MLSFVQEQGREVASHFLPHQKPNVEVNMANTNPRMMGTNCENLLRGGL